MTAAPTSSSTPNGDASSTMRRRSSIDRLSEAQAPIDDLPEAPKRGKLKTLHPLFLTFPDEQIERSYRVRSSTRARKRAAFFSALYTIAALVLAMTIWINLDVEPHQFVLHLLAICISLSWAGACSFPVKSALYQYIVSNWVTPSVCVALVGVYGYADIVSRDDGANVMPVLLLTASFIFIQSLTTHAACWGLLVPCIVFLEALAFLDIRPSVALMLPTLEAWLLLVIIARGLEKINRRNYSLGRATFRAKIAYGEAEKKNNAILRNILPESIISAVRAGHMTSANKRYANVTSIFLGLSKPPPTNTDNIHSVMPVINAFISELEVLCDKHGVEKIKTIGFLFLAACGLPEERPNDDDATAAAEFALDAVAAARRFGFRAKVGLARGPVVAGVVGARLTYDVFGDTVNTSNRMYYYCDADSVTCSPSVHQRLTEDPNCAGMFEFPTVKEQQIKGKGLMRIYTLRRAKKTHKGPPPPVRLAASVGGGGVPLMPLKPVAEDGDEQGKEEEGVMYDPEEDDEDMVEAAGMCPGPVSGRGRRRKPPPCCIPPSREDAAAERALLPPGGAGLAAILPRRASAPVARTSLEMAQAGRGHGSFSGPPTANRWRAVADRVVAVEGTQEERLSSLRAVVKAAASIARMSRTQAAAIAAAARAAAEAEQEAAGSDSESEVSVDESEEEEEGPDKAPDAEAPAPATHRPEAKPAAAKPAGAADGGGSLSPKSAARERKRRERRERRMRRKGVGAGIVDAILEEFEVGSEDEAEEDEELGKLELEIMRAGSYLEQRQQKAAAAAAAATSIAPAGGIGAAGNRRISMQAVHLMDVTKSILRQRREEVASQVSSTRATVARFVARLAHDVGIVRIRGASSFLTLKFDDPVLDKKFWLQRYEETLYPARRILVFAFFHCLLWPVLEGLGGVPNLANRASIRWAMTIPWSAVLMGCAFGKKNFFARHLRLAMVSQLFLAVSYTAVQCLYLDPTHDPASPIPRHASGFYISDLSVVLLLVNCMPGPAVRWMDALVLTLVALVPPIIARRSLDQVEIWQLWAMGAMGVYHAWFHELEARHEFELERELSLREAQVKSEMAESARLLTLCLPRPIVRAALEGKMEIGAMSSQHYSTVAVLCADIVGFTPLSSTLDPQELVRILSELITACDDLADEYNIVRLKTIGDAWLAVAGLEGALDAAAAARLVGLGLAIARVFKEASARFELAINVRIGIASGPCSGGIIGNKRWFWDLFGEAMDSAGAHECGGVPGRVHVSREIRYMVGDAYIFEPRHPPQPKPVVEEVVVPPSPSGGSLLVPPETPRGRSVSPNPLHAANGADDDRPDSFLVIA